MRYCKVRFDRKTSKIVIEDVGYANTIKPDNEDGYYYVAMQDLIKIKRDMIEIEAYYNNRKKRN